MDALESHISLLGPLMTVRGRSWLVPRIGLLAKKNAETRLPCCLADWKDPFRQLVWQFEGGVRFGIYHLRNYSQAILEIHLQCSARPSPLETKMPSSMEPSNKSLSNHLCFFPWL